MTPCSCIAAKTSGGGDANILISRNFAERSDGFEPAPLSLVCERDIARQLCPVGRFGCGGLDCSGTQLRWIDVTGSGVREVKAA